MQNQDSRNQETRKQSMERKNDITIRKKALRLLRLNTPFYLTGLVLILAMKYFYSRAGASQLLWLLAPTSGLVSLISGIPFIYIQDIGYVNHGMKIIAERHLDLSRKLDQALKVENEKEMLLLRVNHLENELRKVKERINQIA